MTNLVIHPELKKLLPPLSEKEYAGLEKDILERGCLSAIVTWNGAIVDGHNRYEICQKHGLPFEVRPLEFASLDDARFWAWTHQDNRRNLTQYQRGKIALQFKPMLVAKAKEKESARKMTLQNSVKSNKECNTCQELADIADVSRDTIARIEYLEEHADDETKEKLCQGKTSINKEYTRFKSQGGATKKEKAAKPKSPRTKKAKAELPVAEQKTPQTPASKNVPCIEELNHALTTTLKDIRRDHPDHLLRNLATHFPEGFIEDLIFAAMSFLHEKKGETATTPILKELNKCYFKTNR